MVQKLDAPDWLIHLFAVTEAGDVRWITEDEYARLDEIPGLPKRGARTKEGKPHRYKHNKRLPFGQPAGGRRIHGHGRLIHISGRQITTADVAAAIDFGYFWLWNTAPRQERPPVVSPDDTDACVLIHNSWYLDGDELRWLVKPHPDIPAGSVVKGMPLAGRGDRAVQRRGRYYATSDIEHVLHHGRLPWMHNWE